MLMIETAVDLITAILDSNRPFAFVPADGQDRAKEIAGLARDHGYGIAVVQVRSRGWMALVVADPGQETQLRRDAREWANEIILTIATGEIEKAYCWPGWFTAMVHSQGADIGPTL